MDEVASPPGASAEFNARRFCQCQMLGRKTTIIHNYELLPWRCENVRKGTKEKFLVSAPFLSHPVAGALSICMLLIVRSFCEFHLRQFITTTGSHGFVLSCCKTTPPCIMHGPAPGV